MRFWRLAALAIVAIGLAPGTWVRTGPPPAASSAALDLVLTPLPALTPDGWPETLAIESLWQLAGEHPDFGGFSAMVTGDDGGFTLYSDIGRRLAIPRPPASPGSPPLEWVPPDPNIRQVFDIESAWRDPATGTVWLAYEYHNAIRRIDADGTSDLVAPAEMARWGANSGPESMARLPDGRFLVLQEREGGGLLFAGDPVEGAAVQAFTVEQFGEFRPTDMTVLPDGMVLVLLRAIRWHLPPFATMLAVGDPAAIIPGEQWPLTPVGEFDRADLRDNYEALAVEPADDGALGVWLVSDDNRSVLQRTLLLKLRWDYAQWKTARAKNRTSR